jgi:hypothetical protein
VSCCVNVKRLEADWDYQLIFSFVHDTLKTVGKNMKGQQNIDEDDVEEHVSLFEPICSGFS